MLSAGEINKEQRKLFEKLILAIPDVLAKNTLEKEIELTEAKLSVLRARMKIQAMKKKREIKQLQLEQSLSQNAQKDSIIKCFQEIFNSYLRPDHKKIKLHFSPRADKERDENQDRNCLFQQSSSKKTHYQNHFPSQIFSKKIKEQQESFQMEPHLPKESTTKLKSDSLINLSSLIKSCSGNQQLVNSHSSLAKKESQKTAKQPPQNLTFSNDENLMLQTPKKNEGKNSLLHYESPGTVIDQEVKRKKSEVSLFKNQLSHSQKDKGPGTLFHVPLHFN